MAPILLLTELDGCHRKDVNDFRLKVNMLEADNQSLEERQCNLEKLLEKVTKTVSSLEHKLVEER